MAFIQFWSRGRRSITAKCSELGLSEERRPFGIRGRRLLVLMFKSEDYLKDVRSHACLICGKDGVDAHHLRSSVTGIHTGIGMKRCGDDLAVPLCRTDHMLCHEFGREIKFWIEYGVDPIHWAEENFKKWKT